MLITVLTDFAKAKLIMSKKIAAEKKDISNKSLDKIVPGEKPRIVWDTRLTGFGLKVIPIGTMTTSALTRDAGFTAF